MSIEVYMEHVSAALMGILSNPNWNQLNLEARGISADEGVRSAALLATLYGIETYKASYQAFNIGFVSWSEQIKAAVEEHRAKQKEPEPETRTICPRCGKKAMYKLHGGEKCSVCGRQQPLAERPPPTVEPPGAVLVTERQYQAEKDARVYYQDIVYHVCNWLDRQLVDTAVVCGTATSPSVGVQEALAEIEDVLKLARQPMGEPQRSNKPASQVGNLPGNEEKAPRLSIDAERLANAVKMVNRIKVTVQSSFSGQSKATDVMEMCNAADDLLKGAKPEGPAGG